MTGDSLIRLAWYDPPVLEMASNRKRLAVCLAGVLVSLLLVGLVSSTFLRHVVQVVPIVLGLAALWQRHPLTAYFVFPIFIIWASLMALIWMYLLGVATFFSGSFSPVEILLTVLIGIFSVIGIAVCLRSSRLSPISYRIAGFVIFAAMQIAAMWISFMPAFANR